MGKKHQEGFTLIELLVLMMVLAVTLGLGVPALNNARANTRMSGAANDLVSSLHAARSEALTRSRSVTMCASLGWQLDRPPCDGGTASLLDGWVVFVDEDTDGVVDDAETIVQAHGPVHPTIRDQAASGADGGPPFYVSFSAVGVLQDIAALPPSVTNIQLCDDRGNKDAGGGRAAGRWINISPAGRPTLIDEVARLQGPENPLGGCGDG